jgi:DNA mismatch repair protein MutL
MVHSRSRQWMFVNGRPVEDRGLRYSLIAAYGGQVPRDASPSAVLFLEVPPSRVDVNVHPAKTEVRFADQGAVYGLVSRAVRAAFSMTGVPGSDARNDAPPWGALPPAVNGSNGTGILPFAVRDGERGASAVFPASREGFPSAALLVSDGLSGTGLEIIGQLFLTYILARSGEDFLLVDQHAAHEKVVYERLMARAEGGGAAQELLVPHTMEASAEETVLIERNLEDLAAAGIRLAPLGRGTWAVNSIPAEADEDSAVELVKRVVAGLSGPGRTRDREAVRHRALSVVACHMAVRAGQRLSDPEMEALIRELFSLANPHSCPHGRPTFQRYARADLERLFARRT